MVNLDIVRKSNRGLSSTLPRIVATFVGGTSGIGRSTLRQLALNTESPTAYIIGRSERNAAPLLTELNQINPRGSFNFIEADVSLIKNVDEACESIKQREKAMNLLFMTPGGLSLVGRRETTEGVDKLFALRYYARMRFIQRLLPLLETSQSGSGSGRVVSVLGGGFEGNIDTNNLDLKRGYNIVSCAMHSVTMTSLAMEHLAASSKRTSFVHVYPGLVGTNIYSNSFPPPLAAVYNYGMWPLMWPFSVNIDESGQRHLYHSTSMRYPANGLSAPFAPGGTDEIQTAVGSDGKVGSGAYLMNWKGDTTAAGKKMQNLRNQGAAQKVWEHTTQLLERAVHSA